MRVLLVTEDYPPGLRTGIGRHVQGLAEALAELEMDVRVLVPNVTPHQMSNNDLIFASQAARTSGLPKSRPFQVHRILQNNFSMLEGMLAYLSREVPLCFDVVHIHDFFAVPAGLAIASALELPVVMTKHCYLYRTFDSSSTHKPSVSVCMALDQRGLECATRIIAVSDHIVSCLERQDRHLASKCQVIRNGTNMDRLRGVISPEEARRALAKRIGLDSPPTYLLVQVGRLCAAKGQDISIEALAMIADQASGSKVHLVMVGADEGREYELLYTRARDLGVDDKIHFVGGIDDDVDLAQFYTAADAVLAPSRYEPFGLAIAEALAVRTLVIAADVDGIPEQIEHLHNGLLYRQGESTTASATALAKWIAWALANPSLARRLASAGPLAQGRALPWRAVAEATAEVYRAAVADHMAPGMLRR